MSLKVESATLDELVANVFKTMTDLEVSPGGAEPGSLPVAALIGLTGEETRIVVIIRMDEGLALKAAGAKKIIGLVVAKAN